MEATFGVNIADGTGTIDKAHKDSIEYGMHENYDYYLACMNRERNKGNPYPSPSPSPSRTLNPDREHNKVLNMAASAMRGHHTKAPHRCPN